MQAPLLFDPTGSVFFDTQTNEGTKLTKLGSEGRSGLAVVLAMRADATYNRLTPEQKATARRILTPHSRGVHDCGRATSLPGRVVPNGHAADDPS